ncbi:MAG: hypothetical protein PUJ51_24860 [Clostridiales bacterium]|nr:hypothetical protein [Clostridiales bacterium]
MATTLKYNNYTIKNIIVNDNVENKKNIKIKKIKFNGKVIWVKPIKLTVELTKYISSVTIKRTNTETEDPSAVKDFEITVTNPNDIPVTHEDDINFYFGDTIEIKKTNLPTTDKVIYRLYDSPIKLTGDTTISVKAKKGVFDTEIVSAIKLDGVTKLMIKNPNSVKCYITITIVTRGIDGVEIEGPTENIELEPGNISNTITFNDGFGTSTVYAKITTRDLTYGHISETRSSSIVYKQ